MFLVGFATTYFSIGLETHAHPLGKFLPVDEKMIFCVVKTWLADTCF